jgi:replicative DNA helicase
MGGFQDSDLVILAGRPGMGKTALAVNIAYNAAEAYARSGGADGAIVGFFSLEMSGSQLAARVLAERSQIPSDVVRRGVAANHELQSFARASHELVQTPLYIDDSGSLSISSLRTRARRLKRQHGLGLLVVDYIQLLSGTGSKQGTDNRVAEVSEITRGLKALAKELNVPILALSQLSRAVEQRENKRPLLSDLRESGSIEQDADVVMFVFREEYYLAQNEPQINTDSHMQWQQDMADAHNKAEAIIAKQRHGRIGICKLLFDPSFTCFSDAEIA